MVTSHITAQQPPRPHQTAPHLRPAQPPCRLPRQVASAQGRDKYLAKNTNTTASYLPSERHFNTHYGQSGDITIRKFTIMFSKGLALLISPCGVCTAMSVSCDTAGRSLHCPAAGPGPGLEAGCWGPVEMPGRHQTHQQHSPG